MLMDGQEDRPQCRGAANMLCGVCFMRFLCQGVRAAQGAFSKILAKGAIRTGNFSSAQIENINKKAKFIKNTIGILVEKRFLLIFFEKNETLCSVANILSQKNKN
jgi:hypothetical protein